MLDLLLRLDEVYGFIPCEVLVDDGDLGLEFHDVEYASKAAFDDGLVLQAVVLLLW